MQYPVNEIFESVQGEATHAGRPSVFIRMQGCDVGCAWCDTKHTWSKRLSRIIPVQDMITKPQDSDEWSVMSSTDLSNAIGDLRARHVVVTGGEPCQYDLMPLTERLAHVFGDEVTVQVETSGTEPIRVTPSTWVTVSPKIGMPGHKDVRYDALQRADEIKHPVAIERNVDELIELLTRAAVIDKKVPIWLQPIWQAPRSREICLSACMQHGFRLSVQTHKVLQVR